MSAFFDTFRRLPAQFITKGILPAATLKQRRVSNANFITGTSDVTTSVETPCHAIALPGTTQVQTAPKNNPQSSAEANAIIVIEGATPVVGDVLVIGSTDFTIRSLTPWQPDGQGAIFYEAVVD